MATYVPNANQTTEPVESQTVESAALEFRTLKKHALQYLTADADASKTTLPAATARAGKFLAFDSITGEPVTGPDIADWTITQSQIAAVETVAADLNEPVSEIETVAASIANVDLVGSSISSVNTVAPSIEDVVVVADNIAAVNNLSNAVTNGDLLTDVYQGAYAANPIKRLDNSSLQNGDLYFNTATNRMMAYASGTWYATETLGATDAALVSYTPDGTGAVPTTAQSKFAETVSVKDFGAVGDGVTDDTAAIQAAIDSTWPAGGSVYFPRGKYLATDTIKLPESSIYLYGEGHGNGTNGNNGSTIYWRITDGISPAMVYSNGTVRNAMADRLVMPDLTSAGVTMLDDSFKYSYPGYSSSANFTASPMSQGGMAAFLTISQFEFISTGVVRAYISGSRYVNFPTTCLAAFHKTRKLQITGSGAAAGHYGTFQIINVGLNYIDYANTAVTAANNISGLTVTYTSMPTYYSSIRIEGLRLMGDYDAANSPTGHSGADGIVLMGVTGSRCHVRDCVIQGFRGVGITVSHCYVSTITNCQIVYNGVGIYGAGANSPLVTNCYVHYNLVGYQNITPGEGCVTEANLHFGVLLDANLPIRTIRVKGYFEATNYSGSFHGACDIRSTTTSFLELFIDATFGSPREYTHIFKGHIENLYFKDSQLQTQNFGTGNYYRPFCIDAGSSFTPRVSIDMSSSSRQYFQFLSAKSVNPNPDNKIIYSVDVADADYRYTNGIGQEILKLPLGFSIYKLKNTSATGYIFDEIEFIPYKGFDPAAPPAGTFAPVFRLDYPLTLIRDATVTGSITFRTLNSPFGDIRLFPNNTTGTVLLGPMERLEIVSFGSGNYRINPTATISQLFSATNVTTDRSFDADTVTVAELADIVGTLLADLKAIGVTKTT